MAKWNLVDAIGLALMAAIGSFVPGCGRPTAAKDGPAGAHPATTVEVVRPLRQAVRRSVEEPGQIEPCELTPIHAKLSGYARDVAVEIGDRVKKGQVLTELWAPEVEADLQQERAMVEQAESRRVQAGAAVEVAQAGLTSAEAKLTEVRAGIKRYEAELTRWQSEFARTNQLASERAVTGSVLDEARSKVQAAEAARDEVRAAVKSAEATLAEARSLLDKARADVVAATAGIDVARAEAHRAEVLLGYARVEAPFDGVVTRRHVDTGHLTVEGPHGEPLFIAIARERVGRALAELEQARVLWLPSLYLGPSWIRHDGQVQTVQGPIQTISKSSLFLGGTAAAGSSVSGPVPAGGPAQVSGLTSILRISDAIFTPLAAQQVVRARQAGVQAATNDALLDVSEAYFDIQLAAGRLAAAREAADNAEALVALTASYARSGAGLEADHRRSLAERDHRRKDVAEAVGQIEIASAELVRLLHLNPRIVVAPVEPPVAVIRLIADRCAIDDLITTGLHHRPELAEAQALVQATLLRLKEARLRPFIPSLALRYSGGGFGGGVNAFFGNFNGRSDAEVNLYWELQNLGFADRAIARSRATERRTALLELMKVQDRVASEVVRAEKTRLAAARQLDEAGRAIPEALSSLSLNLANIRRGSGLPGATRPIEVLQPIQALAQARIDYLNAVLAYNRAQFRLFRALGHPPLLADVPPGSSPPSPDPAPTAMPLKRPG